MESRIGKPWTDEEDELLIELVQKYTFPYVAKKLGRNIGGIKNHLEILGIYSIRKLNGLLRVSDTASMLGVSPHTIRNWIDNKEFPYIRKTFGYQKKKPIYADYSIDIDKVWKWAKTHAHLLDFRKIPETTLYTAPDWIWELRKQRLKEVPINHRRKWTKAEEDYLLFAIKGNHADLERLADHFKRDTNSVDLKIRKLGKANKLHVHIVNGKIFVKAPPSPFAELEKKYQADIKSLLTKWYWEEGKSLSQIGILLGRSKTYGSRLFKKFEIPVRKFEFEPYPITIGNDTHMVLGEKNQSGQKYLQIPTYPVTNCKKCVLEYRVIMEQSLGRYLYPNEYIAHRNGNRTDHRLENLELRVVKRAKKREKTA